MKQNIRFITVLSLVFLFFFLSTEIFQDCVCEAMEPETQIIHPSQAAFALHLVERGTIYVDHTTTGTALEIHLDPAIVNRENDYLIFTQSCPINKAPETEGVSEQDIYQDTYLQDLSSSDADIARRVFDTMNSRGDHGFIYLIEKERLLALMIRDFDYLYDLLETRAPPTWWTPQGRFDELMTCYIDMSTPRNSLQNEEARMKELRLRLAAQGNKKEMDDQAVGKFKATISSEIEYLAAICECTEILKRKSIWDIILKLETYSRDDLLIEDERLNTNFERWLLDEDDGSQSSVDSLNTHFRRWQQEQHQQLPNEDGGSRSSVDSSNTNFERMKRELPDGRSSSLTSSYHTANEGRSSTSS